MSDGLKDSGSRADLFQHGTSLPRADPNAGHRLRLKERFVNGGPDALPDYELLELVLFSAIPRRDTKPAAKPPASGRAARSDLREAGPPWPTFSGRCSTAASSGLFIKRRKLS